MDTTKHPGLKAALFRTVLLELAGPLAVYTAAKAAGLSVIVAAGLGLLLPLGILVHRLATRRGLGQLDLFVVILLVAVMAGSLVSGDPRLVLAKDGIATAVAGIAALASLRARRPLYFSVARPFGEDPGENWDDHWAARAGFRSLMRTVTAVWGAALLADAVLRVGIAYTLPVTVVPLLGGLQYAALIGGLVLFTVRYTKRSGAAAPVR